MASPEEVLENANPGDTIQYTLRGPATSEEELEVYNALKEQYPHLNILIMQGGMVSSAKILEVPNV